MEQDAQLIEDVRNIFKEELAKASENFAAQQRNAAESAAPKQENAAESTETKFSIKSDNDIEKFKKMSYNQYRSERLAFENDSSPAGTQRMLYNPQMKQYEVWEKGDDALLITGIAKSSGEAEKLYEQTYRTTVDTVYECTESFENAKGKDTWDSQFLENRGNGFRNSSESESKRFQSISAGSGSNLSESDNGESINAEPSSKDGGFSMPKFSIDDEAYMQAVNSGDTEAAQKMLDEAAKSAGYTERLYHQTDNEFTIFDTRHHGAGSRDNETPYGIFMKKSDRNIGVKGSKQMPLYAKLTNPLIAETREDLVYKLRKMSKEYSEIKDKLFNLDNEYQAKFDNAKTAWRNYLTEYRKSHPNENRREIYNDKTFNELFDAEDNIVDEWTAEATKLDKQAKEIITKELITNDYDGVILSQDVGSFGKKTEAYIALRPEQVKSADPVTYDDNGNVIPLSERFNEDNPDIRFSFDDDSGRGNGYDGYSMSNNARNAYADGEMPLSKWTKTAIIKAIAEVNPDIDVSGLNLETLKKNFLMQTSWHHTSKYYNKTNFWSISSFVKNLTQEDVNGIKNIKVKKAKRDTTLDDLIDDTYRKIQVIKASGLYKSDNGVLNQLSNADKFDSIYAKAVEILRSDIDKKVSQWRRLPEGHWRKDDVTAYDADPESFILSYYSGRDKLSKNSTLFKKIREVVSKRFNEDNPDIRFSFAEDNDINSFYGDVIRENQNLRWIFSQYDDIYSSRRLDISLNQDDIDRVARTTLKKYSSKYDVNELSERLTAVYDYLEQTAGRGQVDSETISNALFKIAKDILLRSERHDTEVYDSGEPARLFRRTIEIYQKIFL